MILSSSRISRADGFFLAVQFDNQVGAAAAQALALGALVGGGQREFVGQLQRAGQKTGGENRVQRPHGGGHGGETDGEVGAEWRQRDQFQCGFGDDAEQSFGTDKQAVEVEAGLVFVRAAAEADDGAVGQDDFEAEDVIAGDAVFQAARAAGIGGDVAADEIVRAAGGVGRVKQAAPLDGFLKISGVHARLDDGDEIGGVDFPDAVHPFERKHDAAVHGHATADVTVAGAARSHGNLCVAQNAAGRKRTGWSGAGRRRRAGARRTICRRHIGRAWRVQNDFAGQNFFEPAEEF